MPVIIHSNEPVGHYYPGKTTTTPVKLNAFVESNPDLTVIFAHWGGGLFLYELMPKLIPTLRNVYYDTAASLFVYRDRIFHAAAQIAPNKLLFGTDYPLISHRKFLRRVKAIGLPTMLERDLLGENARRVLFDYPGSGRAGQDGHTFG